MSLKSQSKPEKLATGMEYSSSQSGTSNVDKSGVAAPIASNMISQRFDKPIQAMKIAEVFESHFKG